MVLSLWLLVCWFFFKLGVNINNVLLAQKIEIFHLYT